MKSMSQKKRFQSRESWYLLLVSVPLSIFAALMLWGWFREWRAVGDVREKLDAITAAGDPINDSTMAALHQANTSKEDSAAWRDVARALQGLDSKFGELQFRFEYTDYYDIHAPLAGAEFVANYVTEAKPIVDSIRRLTLDTKDPGGPVWQPIIFRGFGTLLSDVQESKNVWWLLDKEFRVAYHAQEYDRAIDALEMSQGLITANDTPSVIVGGLVSNAMRRSLLNSIWFRENDDSWTADQLARLRRLAESPFDVNARWRSAIAGERAMFLSTRGVGDAIPREEEFSPISRVSMIHARSLMNVYQQILSFGDVAKRNRQNAIEAFEKSLARRDRNGNSISLTAVPFASSETWSSMFVPALVGASQGYSLVELGQRDAIKRIDEQQSKLEQE